MNLDGVLPEPLSLPLVVRGAASEINDFEVRETLRVGGYVSSSASRFI